MLRKIRRDFPMLDCAVSHVGLELKLFSRITLPHTISIFKQGACAINLSIKILCPPESCILFAYWNVYITITYVPNDKFVSSNWRTRECKGCACHYAALARFIDVHNQRISAFSNSLPREHVLLKKSGRCPRASNRARVQYRD